MKYTIEGFSQRGLIALGCDAVDAVFLRWFADYAYSGNMESVLHDNQHYFWIDYDNVVRELPISGLSHRDSLRRRLKKLCRAGVLRAHSQIRQYRRKMFYALCEETFHGLVADIIPASENNRQSDSQKNLNDRLTSIRTQNRHVRRPKFDLTCRFSSVSHADQNRHDPSISDPSIIDPSSSNAKSNENEDATTTTLKTSFFKEMIDRFGIVEPIGKLEKLVAEQHVVQMTELEKALQVAHERAAAHRQVAYASKLFHEGKCTALPASAAGAATSSAPKRKDPPPPPQTREQFLDGLRQRIADSRIYFDDHNRIEGRFGVRMDVDREINKIIDEMCKWHGVSREELMI